MFEVYAAIANEWLRGKAMISQMNGKMLLSFKEGENRRREMIKERDKEEKKIYEVVQWEDFVKCEVRNVCVCLPVCLSEYLQFS